MPMTKVTIVVLNAGANTALLANPPDAPAATFNLTLNRPLTKGTCKSTTSGINGTIDLDGTTSASLLAYQENDDVMIQWNGTIVREVDIFAA